jgi:hypothetical protein
LVLPRSESTTSMIGPITLDVKPIGQPGEGNPHAGMDEAGVGNATMGAGLRAKTKVLEEPPDPNVRAPVLDPTGGGRGWELNQPFLPLSTY